MVPVGKSVVFRPVFGHTTDDLTDGAEVSLRQVTYDTFLDDALRQRVGLRLRGLRNERALLQAELAERADVSLTSVQTVEYGVRRVRLTTLDAIARALGSSLDQLVAEQDPYHVPAIGKLNTEDLQVARLFHDAPTETRTRVLHLLKRREPAGVPAPHHGVEAYPDGPHEITAPIVAPHHSQGNK